MIVTELTDTELLDRARDGDESAFTSLYVRHHAAITRLAASYRRHEPDDLVDATFGQVVSQLRRRTGPTEAFRAYLFATLHAEVVASPSLAWQPPVAVPPAVAVVAGLPALGGADREMITRAFESLPDQWQVPLWHTTIVGTDLPALAAGLDVTTSAARPLARYAGRKLRQAYLQAHLDAAPRPACEPHRERLTAHLRGSLDADADAGVRSHLERCDSCRELIAGLSGVDELLARSVVPFFPVVAGRGGVPTPLGAAGSAAIEVTGESPVLDVPDSVGAGVAGDTTSAGFGAWWRRRRGGEGESDPGERTHVDDEVAAKGQAALGFGTWWRSRRTGESDAVDVDSGDAGRPRNEGDGNGHGDTGDTGTGRRGRLVPALGGAVAVTLFVAGLAVFGVRSVRDDSGRGVDEAAADESDATGSAPDGERSSSGSRSRDGRKGPSDRTTTTAAGDDRRPAVDDDRGRVEPVPRRGDSSSTATAGSAASAGSRPDAGSTTQTTTRRSSTTTRPATTTTAPDPDPPPALASWSVAWSGASASAGTLRVTVQSASSGPVDRRSVLVTIALSGGAQAGSLGTGCSGSGGQVTCTVAAPAAGEATTVSIGVTVDGPGESASVSARQGGSNLGSQSVSLTVPEVAA